MEGGMMTKFYVAIYGEVWHGWINIGWFPGDIFKLFDITIGEIWDVKEGITLFSLQIAYFTIALGLNK